MRQIRHHGLFVHVGIDDFFGCYQLRHVQPIVRQAHRLGSILDGIFRVPVLDGEEKNLNVSVSFPIGILTCQSGQRPGATASTKAPTALPLFQSVVKFVIGKSDTLLWIQFINLEERFWINFFLFLIRRRIYLCFGVGPCPPEVESSSPSHIGIDIE